MRGKMNIKTIHEGEKKPSRVDVPLGGGREEGVGRTSLSLDVVV